jgi:SPP1 family predicted phage head-tail adaptor
MSTRVIWPQIDPGKMVHRVTILAENEIVDASGMRTTYVPFLTTWAEIEPVSGKDVISGGQATTTLFVRVTMRWQPGIYSDQRVQTDTNDVFIIQAIENPGYRNILLILNCVQMGQQQGDGSTGGGGGAGTGDKCA